MQYTVAWVEDLQCRTTIEADSEKVAIEKVKSGDRPDVDTDATYSTERKFHII